jgi:carbamate kinase
VGTFYSAADVEPRQQAGWTLIEEPPHGYRRVVASPEPLAVVEEPAIRALVNAGVIVIALGGGGVPVVRRDGRLEGIEAVVDKDLASAMLADHLRVPVLAMVTDVDRIYVNFGRPGARGLGTVSADELRRLAADGQFPAGTMGPKVEAALRFIASGGSEVIVTSPDRVVAALNGYDEGTHVVSPGRAAQHRRARALASTVLG